MPELNFSLRIGEQTLTATVQLPASPIRPVDLLPVLRQLADGVIGAACVDSPGGPVSCRPGCAACCRHVVPISYTEAFALVDLLLEMEPSRRAGILARFQAISAAVEAAGLRESLLPEALGDATARTRAGLAYLQLALPCPFLENELCSIHSHRPLACREFLVTSPAANCSNPSAESVRCLPLPAKLSRILYRFDDGKGDEPPRFLPLHLLLEFAENHSAEDQPQLAGTAMFDNFLQRVVRAGRS